LPEKESTTAPPRGAFTRREAPRGKVEASGQARRRERFQAAERAFRKVVRMCPRDAYSRIKLAEVLERLGQSDQAAVQARAVVRIEPRWRRFVRSFLH
jgi:Flp pilus assembly protein TadD